MAQFEVLIAVVLGYWKLAWSQYRSEYGMECHEKKSVCVLRDIETGKLYLNRDRADQDPTLRIEIIAQKIVDVARRGRSMRSGDRVLAPPGEVKFIRPEDAPDWLRREAVACPWKMSPVIDDPDQQVDDTPLRGIIKTLLAEGHHVRGWKHAITHLNGKYVEARISYVKPTYMSSMIESEDGGSRYGNGWEQGGGWVLTIGAIGWMDHPKIYCGGDPRESAQWLLKETVSLIAEEPQPEPSEQVKEVIKEIAHDRGIKVRDLEAEKPVDLSNVTALFGVSVDRRKNKK